jgi:hypothetical protein
MTGTEAKWVERLREWQDSGKTAEEFAAGKPYKPSTLKWWRTQLQRREKGGGSDPGAREGDPDGASGAAYRTASAEDQHCWG